MLKTSQKARLSGQLAWVVVVVVQRLAEVEGTQLAAWSNSYYIVEASQLEIEIC